MLSALTPLTYFSVCPKPLRGALLGALFAGCPAAAPAIEFHNPPPALDGSFLPNVVPEPGYSLLGACIGCALLLRRRRSPETFSTLQKISDLKRGRLRFSSGPKLAPRQRRDVASFRLIDTPHTDRASMRPLRVI